VIAETRADDGHHAILDRLTWPLPYPGDQLIDADMARVVHATPCRDHAQIDGHLGVGTVSILPSLWITVLVPLPFGTIIDWPPPGVVLV
jgi:hypothetical protein